MEAGWGTTVRRILSNPVLNGWGFVVGLVGLAFGWYTWMEGKSEPLLLGQVPAARTIVVSPERVENIQVLADGQPVKGPISAVQVAVWNSGKRPIRAEDVLEPIKISLEGGMPVIDARALRVTREVTELKLDNSKKTIGELGVRFRILEQGDGILLQIIYAGDVNVPLKGSGVIVGQSTFSIETIDKNTKRDKARSTATSSERALLIVGLLTIGLTFTAMQMPWVLKWVRRIREEAFERPLRPSQLFGTIVGFLISALLAAIGIALVYRGLVELFRPMPPFPF
jgi:hypothetical protein